MRNFLNYLLIGFFVGVGWPWVHGLYVAPSPLTLIGVGQTFQAIDSQYALFCLGFCALVGAICGIFPKGETGVGTQTFYFLDDAWDLLTCWW